MSLPAATSSDEPDGISVERPPSVLRGREKRKSGMGQPGAASDCGMSIGLDGVIIVVVRDVHGLLLWSY